MGDGEDGLKVVVNQCHWCGGRPDMEDGVEGEREPLREAEGTAAGGERFSTGRAEGIRFQWLTVDGPLGVQQEEALKLAHGFFYGGFFFLPWLWLANCFYFWPVLRHHQLDPATRVYIMWSGICCLAFTAILLVWLLTFTIGGERVFGSAWEHLMVYNLADKFQTAISEG